MSAPLAFSLLPAFARRLSVAVLLLGGFVHSAPAGELDDSIRRLRDVAADGQGNEQAARSWETVVQSGPERIPELLAAMNEAGPLGANWLRMAGESIVQQAGARADRLPAEALEKFLLDQENDPRARRLAYEWLRLADPNAEDRLVPKMLHDKSVELRRDAVARLMSQAEAIMAGDRGKAGDVYMEALGAARDEDQIRGIVAQLKTLERKVDLPRHFGFLVDWKIIGPFDNTGRAGFETVFPPEGKLDPSAEYAGKNGPVRWASYSTTDEYGMVDFNKPLGSLKEATAYAWTQFESPADRPAELRLGCKNAWKIWLNGEFVFGRDEYHRGMSIDQYVLPVRLRKGANDILVKACQNEEQETWTVEWQFQLRVCDATGTAILSADRTEGAAGQ